jgi:hypothetical protein
VQAVDVRAPQQGAGQAAGLSFLQLLGFALSLVQQRGVQRAEHQLKLSNLGGNVVCCLLSLDCLVPLAHLAAVACRRKSQHAQRAVNETQRL